jgi:hypothetical protein
LQYHEPDRFIFLESDVDRLGANGIVSREYWRINGTRNEMATQLERNFDEIRNLNEELDEIADVPASVRMAKGTRNKKNLEGS